MTITKLLKLTKLVTVRLTLNVPQIKSRLARKFNKIPRLLMLPSDKCKDRMQAMLGKCLCLVPRNFSRQSVWQTTLQNQKQKNHTNKLAV